MAEYKEIYMRNAFKNNLDLNSDFNSDSQVVDVSYLQVKKKKKLIVLVKIVIF